MSRTKQQDEALAVVGVIIMIVAFITFIFAMGLSSDSVDSVKDPDNDNCRITEHYNNHIFAEDTVSTVRTCTEAV